MYPLSIGAGKINYVMVIHIKGVVLEGYTEGGLGQSSLIFCLFLFVDNLSKPIVRNSQGKVCSIISARKTSQNPFILDLFWLSIKQVSYY